MRVLALGNSARSGFIPLKIVVSGFIDVFLRERNEILGKEVRCDGSAQQGVGCEDCSTQGIDGGPLVERTFVGVLTSCTISCTLTKGLLHGSCWRLAGSRTILICCLPPIPVPGARLTKSRLRSGLKRCFQVYNYVHDYMITTKFRSSPLGLSPPGLRLVLLLATMIHCRKPDEIAVR